MQQDLECVTIALFDAQCNDSDIEVRLNAMKKLSFVANVLGVQKTITELLPYLDSLTESIYNDDEILLLLAEQLAEFLPLIGGATNAFLIMNLLEKLVAVEEPLVREKAIESIKKVSSLLEKQESERLLAPLILRLATNYWLSSKLAAVSLFAVCYEQASIDFKNELVHIYKVLCQDDLPLIRRATACNFNGFAKVLESDVLLNQFVPILKNFAKDQQDSVRVYAVDFGISISDQLTVDDIEKFVILTIAELSCDQSWRVRYQTAHQINSLQLSIGRELTLKYLIPMYQNLIQDTEPQIREASARNIVRFCEILHTTYNDIQETLDLIDPVIISKMLPMIQGLSDDSNTDVREALGGVLGSMCSVLGEENTRNLLVPLITESLNSDSPKLQECLLSNLNSIISIIGISEIMNTVLKIVTDLMNGSNCLWRTRRNLIITINYMVIHIEEEYFDTYLIQVYKKLLNDGVYAVRQTAPVILPILTKKFGIQWMLNSMLPMITNFSENIHYLYRYVCLFCIDELISPTLSTKTNNENLIYIEFLRKVIKHDKPQDLQEKAKHLITKLKTLNCVLNKELQQEWVKLALNTHCENNIREESIKEYAEETIEVFVKENNGDILNVSQKELAQEDDDAYLEGILYLSIFQFLPILKRLSNDLVINVQFKAAKSIFKIQKLNNTLQHELDEMCLNDFHTHFPEEKLLTYKYKIKEFNKTSGDAIAPEVIDGAAPSL